MTYELTNEILYEIPQKYDFTSPIIPAKELYENMRESMIKHGGIGLSCNQVGINAQMFVMGDSKSPESVIGCFNPKIVHMSAETELMDEGCLSLPGILVKKARAKEIRVRYQDYLGAVNTKVFTGMTARVFQHELAHLQGQTLITGLSKLKLDMVLKKAKKLGFKYKVDYAKHERHQ